MNREALLTACRFAAKAIIGRTQLPVLSCLQFTASDGMVSVTGSNLDIFATASAAGEFPACCVDAKRLISFLAAVSADEVSAELKEARLTLRAGSACVVLDVLPHRAFPANPTDEFGSRIALDGELLEKIVAAASTDETRHVLMGVFYDNGTLVATDGRRCHFAKTGDEAGAFIIPTALVSLLQGECVIRSGWKWLTASVDGGVITGRLIEGTYPNWRSAFGPPEISVGMVPAGIPASVKTALAVGCNETILIDHEGTLSCGEYTESDTGLTGRTLRLNGRYLLEALEGCGDGAVLGVTPTRSGLGNKVSSYAMQFSGNGFTAVVMGIGEIVAVSAGGSQFKPLREEEQC